MTGNNIKNTNNLIKLIEISNIIFMHAQKETAHYLINNIIMITLRIGQKNNLNDYFSL